MEHQRIDAFEPWCRRRLLRVPWTARRSNQSILREINPEYSLEGLMLKLKLHYFGHLMWTADSLKQSLMLGKIEGRKKRVSEEMAGWHPWCNGRELGQTSGSGEGQKGLAGCSPWGRKELDMTGQLNNNNMDIIWCQIWIQTLLSYLFINSVTSDRLFLPHSYCFKSLWTTDICVKCSL